MVAAQLLAVAAAMLLTSLLVVPAQARPAFVKCGVERCKVKTLQDRPTPHPVQTTTMVSLFAQPKPDPLPGTRAPFEFHQLRRRNQMAQACLADKVCAKAEIVGVAFYDSFNNQDGVAPNEIELHRSCRSSA